MSTALFLLSALAAGTSASIYPSQCAELQECAHDVGSICSREHLKSAAAKASVEKYMSCIEDSQYDADGCFDFNEAADKACKAKAPRAAHDYMECVSELEEERYEYGTTGDACWTQCGPICGDLSNSVLMDADDIALFEECKSLCQVKLGCHALNEDYYYNPVDDKTRLRPAMTSGCRADLDSGDPIRARLWRGTPERARLQAALQDEDSEDYYRLGELLEEIHGAEFFSDYTYEF